MIKNYNNLGGRFDSNIDDIKDVKNMEDLLTLLISDYAEAESIMNDEFSSDIKSSDELSLKEVNKIIDKANELLEEYKE